MPPKYLLDAFGSDGYLSAGNAAYELRRGQLEMAHLVERAYAASGQVIVEAPTGVGKSYAYLVPAIYHAATKGTKTLIVTKTITLQQQLINEDFAALQKLLPWKFSYGLALGRKNYVCNHNLVEKFNQLPDDLRVFCQTTPGLLRTLPPRMAYDAKERFRLPIKSYDDCDGADCCFMPAKPPGNATSDDAYDKYESSVERRVAGRAKVRTKFNVPPETHIPEHCFHDVAKQQLQSADIVVANFHLLIAHLSLLKLTNSGYHLLPPFDALICDEVHALADTARGALGDETTQNALGRLHDGARYRDAVDKFFAMLEDMRLQGVQHSHPRDRAEGVLWLKGDHSENPIFETMMVELKKVHEMHEGRAKSDRKARQLARHAKTHLERLPELVGDKTDGAVARYIAPRATIGRKCVDVALFLSALWTRRAVVFTSATISVDGDFDYLQRETGTEDAICCMVESPFDFADRSLLYVDLSLPSPSQKTYQAWRNQAAAHIRHLVIDNGGRALCLFTSHRMKKLAYHALSGGGLPFRVYVQPEGGTMVNASIFQSFMQDETSVLLGVQSFWQGVNPIGPSCTMVIIDKIPFAPPDDPIIQALSQFSSNVFAEHCVPRAAIQLKQGIGRLIRTTADHGVVVILDRRLVSRRNRDLLDVRPCGMPVTNLYDEVLDHQMRFPLRS